MVVFDCLLQLLQLHQWILVIKLFVDQFDFVVSASFDVESDDDDDGGGDDDDVRKMILK
jgi:hypothetical protein